MCGAALRLLGGSQGGGMGPFLPVSVTWESAGMGVGPALRGLQGSCALLGTKFLTALESLVTPWGAAGGVISQ